MRPTAAKRSLYKFRDGVLRVWSVFAVHDEVVTEFGVVEGKIQTSKTWEKGKNAGRANATTASEQAIIRADQLYRKKIKEGFLPDPHQAAATTNALGGVLPMLAHRWEDHKDKATFPCYVQPKLDGIRCLARVINGKCELFTRSQKPITTVPHIKEAVEAVSKISGVADFVLDGELYNHELHDDFGKILGTIKRGEISKDAELIQYHVYDMVNELPFTKRTLTLHSLLLEVRIPAKHLKVVKTFPVQDSSGMMQAVAGYVALGYEGGIYRTADGLYKGKRSTDLLKIKQFKDEEFEVIGCQEGTGKLTGLVGSWLCVTKKGVEFSAKQAGDFDKIPKFNSAVANGRIGQKLTVKFQDYTPDGVPRFPVALRFREDA